MTESEKRALLDMSVTAMSKALADGDTRAALDALSFHREVDGMSPTAPAQTSAMPCLHSVFGRGTCFLPAGHKEDHDLGPDLSGVNSVALGNAPAPVTLKVPTPAVRFCACGAALDPGQHPLPDCVERAEQRKAEWPMCSTSLPPREKSPAPGCPRCAADAAGIKEVGNRRFHDGCNFK